MAALVGKFVFVSNMGNQEALPSVHQEAIGKGSELNGCAILPTVWLASPCCGTAVWEGDTW